MQREAVYNTPCRYERVVSPSQIFIDIVHDISDEYVCGVRAKCAPQTLYIMCIIYVQGEDAAKRCDDGHNKSFSSVND